MLKRNNVDIGNMLDRARPRSKLDAICCLVDGGAAQWTASLSKNAIKVEKFVADTVNGSSAGKARPEELLLCVRVGAAGELWH